MEIINNLSVGNNIEIKNVNFALTFGSNSKSITKTFTIEELGDISQSAIILFTTDNFLSLDNTSSIYSQNIIISNYTISEENITFTFETSNSGLTSTELYYRMIVIYVSGYSGTSSIINNVYSNYYNSNSGGGTGGM